MSLENRPRRRWCFVTLKPGTEPLKALVETFLDTWQLGATDAERVKQQNGWIELLRDGKAMLRDLLDATERRYKELDRTKPPAFLLYVDQGEELYVRAEERPSSIAWARQRHVEFAADQLFDEPADPLADLALNRTKPVVEKVTSSRLQAARNQAS